MSDLSLEIAVPGLAEIGIDAGFALDLIFSVSAAIDIESTFNVFFPEGSFIEVNIFDKEIVKQEITGLVVESVPLSIGAEIDLSEDIQLDVVLRLRTGLAISSELDIVGLDLGAGAEVAIWLDIFKYTTTYREGSSGSECSAAEIFALTAGVAVELDVEIGELELGLAPSVIITLASSTATTSTVTIGEGSQWQWGWRQTANGGNGNGIESGAAGNGTQIGGSGSGSSGSSGSGSSGSGSGSGSGSDASSPENSSPEGSSPESGSDNSSPQAGNDGQGAGSGSPTTTVSLTGSGANPTSSADALAHGGSGLPEGMTTSTLTTTNTYTITSCAASVTNCPNSYTQQIVTSMVVSYTTVCPVTATQTGGAATGGNGGLPSGPAPTSSVAAITGGSSPSSPAGESAGSVTSAVATTPAGPVTVPTPQSPVNLTPYATPSTSTETIPETVPTPAPTVIVTEATTVCPVTATRTGGGHKPSGTGVFVTATGVKSTATAPVWPSGVAQPSGWNRPSNGTIPRPSGPAGTTPTPAVTGGNGATPSASGSQPTGTAVQASGAGKLTFGVLAAIAPLFVALI